MPGVRHHHEAGPSKHDRVLALFKAGRTVEQVVLVAGCSREYAYRLKRISDHPEEEAGMMEKERLRRRAARMRIAT